MFASKPILAPANPSDVQLPTMSKTARRRFRSSPTPSYTSGASTSTYTSENVSALKEKYSDYAMWLRASSRRNREPLFTHELLKHSLCQMGIETTQADQLVSTCTWYVYQFHKELGGETSNESPRKSPPSPRRRPKKNRTTKSRRSQIQRGVSTESTADIQLHKEDFVSSGSSPSRTKYPVLPSIDSNSSPRSRRVDFDSDPSISQPKSPHWRSAINKTRALPKLRPPDGESTISTNNEIQSEASTIDLDLSQSQRNLNRQTRSILRKQNSTTSSVTSPDVQNRPHRYRSLTPASTIIDEIPLGTKSQRLFGGSECFAQIMNELEEQNS